MNHRIIVFCGNYGSGKTEVALNTALRLSKEGKKVTLVDLDVVNPYFRSSEQRKLLEAAGIKVLAPTFAGTTVDIPALPAEIQSVFAEKSRTVIFDVGGDDTGATALGKYFPYLAKEDKVIYMVVNERRPFSATAQQLWELQQAIEYQSRQKVDYYINNSNLAHQTTVKEVLDGQKLMRELTALSGVPQKYITGMPEILAQLPAAYVPMLYPIELHMRPDWLDLEDMAEE